MGAPHFLMNGCFLTSRADLPDLPQLNRSTYPVDLLVDVIHNAHVIHPEPTPLSSGGKRSAGVFAPAGLRGTRGVSAATPAWMTPKEAKVMPDGSV